MADEAEKLGKQSDETAKKVYPPLTSARLEAETAAINATRFWERTPAEKKAAHARMLERCREALREPPGSVKKSETERIGLNDKPSESK
jgi:F0F1-type ATP synthase membrane subunit b/b'